MPPRVVFALQAPTLLNILARSDQWRLEVANLGDCKDLTETSLLESSRWDGHTAGVEHVFVCTPLQEARARRFLPKAKLWWVLHTGLTSLATPPNACDVLAFSNTVAALHKTRNPLLKTAVVVPAYTPGPALWSWRQNYTWTLKNRPTSRNQAALQLILNVRNAAGVQHDFFGQDWPNGFADKKKVT
jgi:hypothetical protein